MPSDCDIAQTRRKVQRWATSLQFDVKRIYLFGSQAKGTEKKDSDIDIAIEFTEPLSTLAWMDWHEEWEKGLSKILEGRVHLELYAGDDTPSLKAYISESTTVVLY